MGRRRNGLRDVRREARGGPGRRASPRGQKAGPKEVRPLPDVFIAYNAMKAEMRPIQDANACKLGRIPAGSPARFALASGPTRVLARFTCAHVRTRAHSSSLRHSKLAPSSYAAQQLFHSRGVSASLGSSGRR